MIPFSVVSVPQGRFINFVKLVPVMSGFSFTVGEVDKGFDYHLPAIDPDPEPSGSGDVHP